eukprot:15452606-Alexandrium_andersonii.AAC.2
MEGHFVGKDPKIKPNDLQFFHDTMPKEDPMEVLHSTSALNDELQERTFAIEKETFSKDKLAVAKDTLSYGIHMQKLEKRGRREHLLRVMHERAQNCEGTGMVKAWMDAKCRFLQTDSENLDPALEQATLPGGVRGQGARELRKQLWKRVLWAVSKLRASGTRPARSPPV